MKKKLKSKQPNQESKNNLRSSDVNRKALGSTFKSNMTSGPTSQINIKSIDVSDDKEDLFQSIPIR